MCFMGTQWCASPGSPRWGDAGALEYAERTEREEWQYGVPGTGTQ